MSHPLPMIGHLQPRLLSALLVAASAAALAEPRLELAHLPEPKEVARLVWLNAPSLVDARARLGLAAAEVTRAGLLPNPSLDVSAGGFPLGETNPVGLSVGQVANAGATLSESVELFKRGPRAKAAEAARTATRLEARESLRQALLDFAQAAAEVATAEVRIGALTDSAAGAAKLTTLQEARTAKGDAPGLDADRARLEEEKLEQSLGIERQHLEEALMACSRLAGLPCGRFGSRELAQAYLESADLGAGPRTTPERDDLRALTARRASAEAQAALAEARAVPDPTFRVGYLKDQFIISGNNPSTVAVGVSVPLPLFDRGQADAETARVLARAAEEQRGLLSSLQERDTHTLEVQLAHAKVREQQIEQRSLPLAHRVVDNLEKALLAGASLQEVILARRSLAELTIDAIEVDLDVFRLSTQLERVSGRTRPMPDELADP